MIAQGDVWTLEAKPPSTREVDASREQLAAMLGLAVSDLGATPLWVDTGSEQLVIPLASAAAVRRAAPDPALLAASRQRAARRGRHARDGLRLGGGRTAFDPGALFLSQARRDRRGSGNRLGVRESGRLAGRDGCAASAAMVRRPGRGNWPALQTRARRGLRRANFRYRAASSSWGEARYACSRLPSVILGNTLLQPGSAPESTRRYTGTLMLYDIPAIPVRFPMTHLMLLMRNALVWSSLAFGVLPVAGVRSRGRRFRRRAQLRRCAAFAQPRGLRRDGRRDRSAASA